MPGRFMRGDATGASLDEPRRRLTRMLGYSEKEPLMDMLHEEARHKARALRGAVRAG